MKNEERMNDERGEKGKQTEALKYYGSLDRLGSTQLYFPIVNVGIFFQDTQSPVGSVSTTLLVCVLQSECEFQMTVYLIEFYVFMFLSSNSINVGTSQIMIL